MSPVSRTQPDSGSVAPGSGRQIWITAGGVLGGLSLLIALFFNKMAFTNLILARGDTFLYFYPYWDMASQALRNGRIPLWNPYIFMGAPFVANSQAGFFYPLNWPLWLFLNPPDAVNAAILIHLLIAGVGAYLLGRRSLNLQLPAALLGAVLFALGGYLSAQVEHVNQVQGLAWLPWFFVALQSLISLKEPANVRKVWLTAVLLVGVLFSLQLLAGHTQTAFISGVAISLWLLVAIIQQRGDWSQVWRLATVLLGAVIVSGLLAAVQLGPTLELVQHSARQGGLSLPEVLSFSWHPLHLTRSLLPSYGQPLFSEYVAFLPLSALLLAFIGAWGWRERPPVQAWLVLIGVSLVLALGRFTPVYWLLGQLPGFDLFRVPARWLAVYGLGGALLAGTGLQVLIDATGNGRPYWQRIWRPLLAGLVVIAVLMAWGFVAPALAEFIPAGPEAVVEAPSGLTVMGWLVELAALFSLLFLLWWKRSSRLAALTGLALLAVSVLWLGSRSLPYNHLTTPAAYNDLRPPSARLQALAQCVIPDEPCPTPPARFLSLSDTFFDPGDQAEINSIFAGRLDTKALFDYTVAIKQKEIIAPNLSMSYSLPAVDGFDGGVLPLQAYSQLMQAVLPEEIETADGRLREFLDTLPSRHWLDLFNAAYLITDKTADEWRQGVFFDRQHDAVINDSEPVEISHVPRFEANEIWLLSEGRPPIALVTMPDGDSIRLKPQLQEAPDLYHYELPDAAEIEALSLMPCLNETADCRVEALTLVDTRDGSFQPLVPGPYRLIHSGDVKIYEYATVLDRAYMVYDWARYSDQAAAMTAMQGNGFDVRQAAVIVDDSGEALQPPGRGQGEVHIQSYDPERIVVDTTSDQPGLLVLTDAAYPGWQVFIDGRPARLLPTNGLFRGVMVPAGDRVVSYEFRPDSVKWGGLLSVLGLLLVALSATVIFSLHRTEA